ncbi:MAG TPA: molybdopterin dinucleotide binding domain-containing protein [Rubrobacteraceae bacterium]|nr:molybdopterin dinucleotide binding domain-containing protein [Rubrobacteraceae bacterium]
MNPDGRAIILPAEYLPPPEQPSEEYPFNDAAPEPWAELSAPDAESLGIGEGDVVRVESPRGSMQARARISGIREGVVFVPFHYGYFDTTGAPAHVASGVLSVALTGGAVLLLKASHPPVGATTLIVSLGLLQTPPEMSTLMIGVTLLTAAGWAINRAFGVPMPVWSVKELDGG